MRFLQVPGRRAYKAAAAVLVSCALLIGAAVIPAAAAEKNETAALEAATSAGWPGDTAAIAFTFADINRARKAKGLKPVRLGLTASVVAQEWSNHLANTGELETSGFATDKRVAGWVTASENLATQSSAWAPVAGWLSDETESANILQPDINVVGIGITGGAPDSYGSRAVVNFYNYRTLPEKTYATTGSFFAEVLPQPVFTDVPKDSQFAREIAWLSAHRVTTGYQDGTYRPVTPVLRDAMAAFLYRISGTTDVDFPKPPFRDVAADSQFSTPIRWLAQSGITTGYPDGTFRPFSLVNRDAMAAYLYRMAGSPAYTAPKKSPFKDVGTDNQFYKEISWLASTGISTGWVQPDGTRTFAPLEPVNRDAMAAFLYRFVQAGYVEM